MKKAELLAMEKLRIITNWMDYQNESFNFRLKTISDIEKLFDYCEEHDIEFADSFDCEMEEMIKHKKAINKLLRYKIYEI